MGFWEVLFGKPPYPPQLRPEVERLLDELIKIGKQDDYLSETPGGTFNVQCRHTRAREIGRRLHEIGGYALMEFGYKRVRKKLGAALSAHLEYAWSEIGDWMR